MLIFFYIVLYDEAKTSLNEDDDDMIPNASYEHATPRGIESKT